MAPKQISIPLNELSRCVKFHTGIPGGMTLLMKTPQFRGVATQLLYNELQIDASLEIPTPVDPEVDPYVLQPAGKTGALVLDDGTNWRVSLSFNKGLLWGNPSIGATSGTPEVTWTPS